eukprot:6195380-Pleurochrysis_carterae.AAC.1
MPIPACMEDRERHVCACVCVCVCVCGDWGESITGLIVARTSRQVLIPDISVEDALQSGEEDWIEDAEGSETMSKQQLFRRRLRRHALCLWNQCHTNSAPADACAALLNPTSTRNASTCTSLAPAQHSGT